MKAIIYEEFGGEIKVKDVPYPELNDESVIIKVMATGICRSDWHGWMGHDKDIVLPHVPGHELAGIVEETGKLVSNFKKGDRVTLPFVCGCGHCHECHTGNQQVCENQFQPGFTAWGSFAEYVAIDYADLNLVKIPDAMSFETAASLGCRFVTSFRAIVKQGALAPGEWVAVHGCGGVGLSAIMIAEAMGAKVIAVDISDEKLDFAKTVGAHEVVNAQTTPDVVNAIKSITDGGAHVSVDALGSKATCHNSISCLRIRGRHVQVGLMAGTESSPEIPMGKVIAHELEIKGSHGMQAYEYPSMLNMIESGKLQPQKLIGKTINLEKGVEVLKNLNHFKGTGVTVINDFS
ncbi:zinc-binding dehydrogenase [Leptobacterium flavescens]|uniref:Zinc-binding dehydrogenase n=1 Tax=Leptobacterium flavescens TaxID=472055 RepID=A0A6P0UH01_9FLAO|nr:zinc-dependent alcohol dehydrogenase family protein [Leptobacterium flavescens]NER12535.1 zinc-binding dehydrogenase [Leptobacterium flavescens]